MIGFAMGNDNQLRGGIESISMRSAKKEVSLESDVVELNSRARQLKKKSKKSNVVKGDKKSKSQPVLSVSRFRNQKFESAECWDLLNQRWTQVVSEKVSKTPCLIDY